MMRTLMLLRHAKAEGFGPSDHERPLAPRGLAQSRGVGDYLIEKDLVPDLVLCSTALRTRQTWAEAAAALGDAATDNVDFVGSLYDASPRIVRDLVAMTDPAHRRVLVIGHEPIMSMTATAYAREGSESAMLFTVKAGLPTAALAHISLEDWGDSWGELRAVVRAEEG